MTNYDEKTRISYGVISPHSINQECLSSLYDEGTDPHYESTKKELISDITSLCENYGIDVDNIDLDNFIQEMNEHYESSDGQCDYSDKEYDLHISGDNFGIFVMRSPYYTYCRKCSPCAPGAGDLDNPLEIEEIEVLDNYDRAYCLGPEYFSDNEYDKIPYRVFKVDNDQEVI